MMIFLRSQVASLLATLVDFLTTILLRELFGIWYLAATSVGSLCGGVAGFLLGRHFTFRAGDGKPVRQAIRYLLVWTGSILLNVTGVFLLTTPGHLNYIVSKVIASVIVGIFFNYLLQKYFVFKSTRESSKVKL
ncbi:MAG: GtrA family protein [Bacteroidota bacterium]